MSEIDSLVRAYEKYISVPWQAGLAGPQKVIFAVYDPPQERRLRLHIPDFERVTKTSGHGWLLCDLTDSFPTWMANHEYREEYFRHPEDLGLALESFAGEVAGQVEAVLQTPAADGNSVVALSGVASLFGLASLSALIQKVAPAIRGRLLVFFPGRKDGATYRLLDARDGHNYLAVAISAADGD